MHITGDLTRACTKQRGTANRPKILILIKGLGLGGAERLLVDSLPFLNRARFEYHVGYLLPWKCFLVPELERAGIPVHSSAARAYGTSHRVAPAAPGLNDCAAEAVRR